MNRYNIDMKAYTKRSPKFMDIYGFLNKHLFFFAAAASVSEIV